MGLTRIAYIGPLDICEDVRADRVGENYEKVELISLSLRPKVYPKVGWQCWCDGLFLEVESLTINPSGSYRAICKEISNA